jgi:hypothetical protein
MLGVRLHLGFCAGVFIGLVAFAFLASPTFLAAFASRTLSVAVLVIFSALASARGDDESETRPDALLDREECGPLPPGYRAE